MDLVALRKAALSSKRKRLDTANGGGLDDYEEGELPDQVAPPATRRKPSPAFPSPPPTAPAPSTTRTVTSSLTPHAHPFAPVPPPSHQLVPPPTMDASTTRSSGTFWSSSCTSAPLRSQTRPTSPLTFRTRLGHPMPSYSLFVATSSVNVSHLGTTVVRSYARVPVVHWMLS